MAEDGKSTAWIQVTGVIVAALIAGAVTIWTQRPQPPADPTGSGVQQPPIVNHAIPVMGQLESGINRQGMDFSDNGIQAENAPICAELCRTNNNCKAMTYVISLKTCWLKAGVPAAYPPGGPDYVSAVKQ